MRVSTLTASRPDASVIIACYNASKTLDACLSSVARHVGERTEIIVVDDCSTDNTAALAARYPCRIISLKQNKGQSFARNTGAAEARGQILIFIDADVEIISADTFSYLFGFFGKYPMAAAVSAVFTTNCTGCNALSAYKHLYMCYVWNLLPDRSSDVVTSFFAIKRDIFFRTKQFNTALPGNVCEDAEFGQQLILLNCEIYTDRSLKVGHRHNYDLLEFVRMEFLRSLNQTLLFFGSLSRTGGARPSCCYLQSSFYYSLALVAVLWLGIFLLPSKAVLVLIICGFLLVLNVKFLGFIAKEKGLRMAALSLFILIFDLSICLAGIAIGLVARLIGAVRI